MNEDSADHDSPNGAMAYPVRLGRDAVIRPTREVPGSGAKKFQCRCCDQFTLDVVDECDVCGNCGWEDWYECHDRPTEIIRPNYLSLTTARTVVARFGPAASCNANRAGGLSVEALEKLSPKDLAALKSWDT